MQKRSKPRGTAILLIPAMILVTVLSLYLGHVIYTFLGEMYCPCDCPPVQNLESTQGQRAGPATAFSGEVEAYELPGMVIPADDDTEEADLQEALMEIKKARHALDTTSLDDTDQTK